MGFGTGSPVGVTPGRKTVVTLDVASYGLSQPAFWREWAYQEISAQNRDVDYHTHCLPGIGWRLLSYEHTLNVTHEREESDGGILSLIVPTGFELIKQQRWYSEFPGVPQGSLRSTGDGFYQKTVRAGDSFADTSKAILSADAAAFPGPSSAADNVPMDRVAIGTQPSAPGDVLTVRYKLPVRAQIGTFMRVYFSGVPGSTGTTDALKGTGQYCLSLRGDGWVELFEKRLSDGAWVTRFHTWQSSRLYGGGEALLSIHSDARQDVDGKWQGTKILFHFHRPQGIVETLVAVAIASLGGMEHQVYRIPRKVPGLQPAVSYPRADVRRDVFAAFQLRTARYYPEGTVTSKTFTLPFVPKLTSEGGEPITIQWLGDIRNDTSISVEVFEKKTGVALVPAGPAVPGPRGGYQSFEIASRERAYYAVVTLASEPGQLRTSTLQRLRAIKNPGTSLSVPTPVIPPVVSAISLMGQDSDPSHESGTITMHDLKSELEAVKKRGRIQSMIEVQYDPNDVTKTSTLFRGFLMTSRARRRGSTWKQRGFGGGGSARVWPAPDWATHHARLVGEWQRLSEMLLPQTYSFDRDHDTNILAVDGSGDFPAFKVTDIIYTLLKSVLPDQMLDIPDMPLRYFTDGKAPLVFEIFSPILPTVSWLARNYLGAYLVYDANATALDPGDPNRATDKHGCWRLKLPKILPCVPLAEFHTDPPWLDASDGPVTFRKVTNTNSYDDTEDEETEQVIKHTFIRKGTYYQRVVPPEANLIVVTGVGVPASEEQTHILAATSVTPELQLGPYVAFNYKSAWLYENQPTPPATDPSDPDYCDYLGDVIPLYYCDPGLTTETACMFALRRLYDMCAHARKLVVFEAPLILVTDILDTKQIRPRPLMYGDPVLVDGDPYFVGSVAIDYDIARGGDRVQMAAYELFSTPPMLGESSPLVTNQAITASRMD